MEIKMVAPNENQSHLNSQQIDGDEYVDVNMNGNIVCWFCGQNEAGELLMCLPCIQYLLQNPHRIDQIIQELQQELINR